MKRFETTSYRDVEDWNDRIASLNGKGNIIPFEGTVSKNRGMMFNNASTQIRTIAEGEVPYVDTLYTYDIMTSTKNVFSDKDVHIVKKIDKYIGGRKCSTSAIITVDDNMVYDYHKFEEYVELGAGYGVKMINDFEKLEEGETIPAGDSIMHTNSYNEHGEYQWGVNALTVLGIDIKSIEDAGLNSEGLCKKFRGWKVEKQSIVVDVNSDIVKNLYGDRTVYKPFPLPGEKIENDMFMCISKHQRNTQFIKANWGIDCVSKTDNKYYFRGRNAFVADITVRQPIDEVCYNSYLAAIIEENRKYEREIYDTMKSCMNDEDATFSKDFMDMYLFLECIFEKKAGFKQKKIVGGHNIVVDITLVDEEYPEAGQKNTGRCGNKYTVSEVYEDGKYSSDDGNIEYLGNCLAMFNRSIMEVFLEMFLNRISIDFFNMLKSGKYEDSYMKQFILDIVEILSPTLYEAYVDVFENNNGWEDLKSEGVIRWYLDTYNSGVNIKTCYEAYKFMQTRGLHMKRSNVYYKKKDGTTVVLGQAMVSRLFIAPLKQVADTQLSLRSQGAYDTRGIIIRTDDSRYRNSPCRKSSLYTDIQANTMHTEDLAYLNSMSDQESIQVVNALFGAMGVSLVNPHMDKVEEN